MQIFKNGSNLVWEIGKAAWEDKFTFANIYLTHNSDNPLTKIISVISLPIIAISEITSGIRNLYKEASNSSQENQICHSATALNLVKIVHGGALLSHTYNPSVYTSLFLGSYSLINGLIQVKIGADQIKFAATHYVNDCHQSNTTNKNYSFKSLAEGIVSFSLGMYGSYHGANRVFQELHQLKIVMSQKKSQSGDTSHPINRPAQGSDSKNKAHSKSLINKKMNKFPSYVINQLSRDTILGIKRAGLSPDEFLQISKHLCLDMDVKEAIVAYSTTCLTKDKKYPNWYFSELVAETIFRTDDPSRTIEQRIESLSSAIQMTDSWVVAFDSQKELKSLNAATILNDDYPGAIYNKFPENLYNDTLLSKANVYIRRIKQNTNICAAIEKIRSINGKPLDFIEFLGHGNERFITFGNDISINTKNVKEVADCIQKTNALAPGAPITVASCFSGDNRWPQLNLAERLAGETSHPVYGATQIIRRAECSYPINEKTGFIGFQCEKTTDFEDDLPGTQIGKYIARFEKTLDSRDRLTVEFDCLNFSSNFSTCYCYPSSLESSVAIASPD